jgi:hypothetical protein
MSTRHGVIELCARTLSVSALLLTGDCVHDPSGYSLKCWWTIVAGGCHGVV